MLENSVEVKSHKRVKKRSLEELLKGQLVEVDECELPVEEMTRHRCGYALEKSGRKYIPAQVKVHEYYRATYVCRDCENSTAEKQRYSL